MKYVYNARIQKDKRASLRNNATRAEQLLWFQIRSSKLGYKFRRQHGVGPYILDFYCPEKRFAIELDGGQHNDEDTIKYDRDRTNYLNALHIQVIRFWNNQIYTSMPTVLEIIQRTIRDASHTTP